MYGVEMHIVLQRLAWSTAIQSCNDRWSLGPIRVFAPHIEPIGCENFSQPIGDRSSRSCRAGYTDQFDCSFNQTFTIKSALKCCQRLWIE